MMLQLMRQKASARPIEQPTLRKRTARIGNSNAEDTIEKSVSNDLKERDTVQKIQREVQIAKSGWTQESLVPV